MKNNDGEINAAGNQISVSLKDAVQNDHSDDLKTPKIKSVGHSQGEQSDADDE